MMEWGDLALAAQAEGALAPAWKRFVKTMFFVSILRSPDDDPKNFQLHAPLPNDGKGILIISEVRERLDPAHGDGTVALSGADILARVEEGTGIEVLLRGSNFYISRKRVEWLRSGVNVTRARIATRRELLAAAPAAPLPVLVVERRSVPRPAERPASNLPVGARPAMPGPKGSPFIRSLYDWRVLASVAGFIAFTGGIFAVATMGRAPDQSGPAVAASAAPLPVPAAPAAKGAPAAQAEPIVSFSPADGSFTVNLPGLAEEVELSPDQVSRLADMESHQYRLHFGGRAYAMESAEYRASAPPDLNAAMDEVQRTIIGDGTLLATQAVPLRGATGREVRVRLRSGAVRAARFVFNGKKYGMVMVTVPASASSAGQVDAFLNSFQLSAPPTGM